MVAAHALHPCLVVSGLGEVLQGAGVGGEVGIGPRPFAVASLGFHVVGATAARPRQRGLVGANVLGRKVFRPLGTFRIVNESGHGDDMAVGWCNLIQTALIGTRDGSILSISAMEINAWYCSPLLGVFDANKQIAAFIDIAIVNWDGEFATIIVVIDCPNIAVINAGGIVQWLKLQGWVTAEVRSVYWLEIDFHGAIGPGKIIITVELHGGDGATHHGAKVFSRNDELALREPIETTGISRTLDRIVRAVINGMALAVGEGHHAPGAYAPIVAHAHHTGLVVAENVEVHCAGGGSGFGEHPCPTTVARLGFHVVGAAAARPRQRGLHRGNDIGNQGFGASTIRLEEESGLGDESALPDVFTSIV